MSELWKPILQFPNYHISSFGNVKNIITNKLLKLNHKGGYYNVSLTHLKIRKTLAIHRLVATAFIFNTDHKPDVNHKDKNRLNNCIDNLEWMTRSENNFHRCKDIKLSTNKKKSINRINKETNIIIQSYNSIEEAAFWVVDNKLSATVHNARNSIGNCICGLSNTSYGFKWEIIKHDNLINEIWRQISFNNCEHHFVSNLGRFKNSNGIIMDNYKINSNGYIRININNKTHLLHRLIAITFIDNPNCKPQVNHIDGNKVNNNVDNLEWVNNQENQIHKHLSGLGNNYTRKIAKYTLDNVIIKEYLSISLASKENNISKSSISGVLRNNRKTAGGFIWKYLD